MLSLEREAEIKRGRGKSTQVSDEVFKGDKQMKVAISSSGPSLDSRVDPRFGRCQFLLIVELDDMSFNAVPNGVNTLEGGSGIQAAKSVVDVGAQVLLTGYIGPNAERVLSSAGLKTVSGVSGTVCEAVRRFKKNSLVIARQSQERNRHDMETRHRGKSQLRGRRQGRHGGFGRGRGVRYGGEMGGGHTMGQRSNISSTKSSSRRVGETLVIRPSEET
jgi:predicted Fe-Mo cluster-binding NifX family protein